MKSYLLVVVFLTGLVWSEEPSLSKPEQEYEKAVSTAKAEFDIKVWQAKMRLIVGLREEIKRLAARNSLLMIFGVVNIPEQSDNQ